MPRCSRGQPSVSRDGTFHGSHMSQNDPFSTDATSSAIRGGVPPADAIADMSDGVCGESCAVCTLGVPSSNGLAELGDRRDPSAARSSRYARSVASRERWTSLPATAVARLRPPVLVRSGQASTAAVDHLLLLFAPVAADPDVHFSRSDGTSRGWVAWLSGTVSDAQVAA